MFGEKIQQTIHVSFGGWPTAPAICVTASATTHVRTKVNGVHIGGEAPAHRGKHTTTSKKLSPGSPNPTCSSRVSRKCDRRCRSDRPGKTTRLSRRPTLLAHNRKTAHEASESSCMTYHNTAATPDRQCRAPNGKAQGIDRADYAMDGRRSWGERHEHRPFETWAAVARPPATLRKVSPTRTVIACLSHRSHDLSDSRPKNKIAVQLASRAWTRA